jgi:hypothetical protein
MFKKSGKLELHDNMNFYIHNQKKIFNYNLTKELESNIFNTVMICIKDSINNILFEAEGKVEYRKPMDYIYNLYIGEKNLTEFLLNNDNKYIDVELIVIKQIEDEVANNKGDKEKDEPREDTENNKS